MIYSENGKYYALYTIPENSVNIEEQVVTFVKKYGYCGIDEIKIQSDQKTNSTSVVLGKYLSPDFYVGYAIGIGNAVDTLQIQYKLTEQWVLKTQSGEQQKAELLFTIESD